MQDNETTDLAVAITCGRLGAKILACEGVTWNDLCTVRHETWYWGMRAGILPPDIDRLACTVVPGPSLGKGILADYRVELSGGPNHFSHRYTVDSLETAARRGTRRLYDRKVVEATDQVHYFITSPANGGGVDPAATGLSGHESGGGAAGPSVRVKRHSQPLVLEQAPLAEFLAASHVLREGAAPLSPTEEDRENHIPIFIDDEVWQEGRDLSRRGGDLESAAIWVGRLLRDTATPELFMVVEACIAAAHATERKYSVAFSGDTWGNVRDLLDQRRRRLNRPHERMLGCIHGHNFTPDADEDGRPVCAACDRLATCPNSTAVASVLDFDWHRTVFPAAPWSTLGVWGFTARGEEVWQVYGLANGVLRPRTIRAISPPAIARIPSTLP